MCKKTEPKKKSLIGKLIRFILKLIAIAAAISACYVMIKKKLGEKRESGNFNRIVKEYFNYFGNRVINTDAGKFDGMLSKNAFASTVIDLSESYFLTESFISLECLCSAITIIVPQGAKVSVDGLIKGSNINNGLPGPCGDDSQVLYIATRSIGSNINITVKK